MEDPLIPLQEGHTLSVALHVFHICASAWLKGPRLLQLFSLSCPQMGYKCSVPNLQIWARDVDLIDPDTPYFMTDLRQCKYWQEAVTFHAFAWK